MRNFSRSNNAPATEWAENYSEDVSRRSLPPNSGSPAGLPRLELGAAYAETARIAGRLNAAHISEEERNALLTERERLLRKKFEGTISRKECNRLQYVRWSLDRIEDARYGHTLDALENAVGRYEQFIDEVRDLKSELERAALRKK